MVVGLPSVQSHLDVVPGRWCGVMTRGGEVGAGVRHQLVGKSMAYGDMVKRHNVIIHRACMARVYRSTDGMEQDGSVGDHVEGPYQSEMYGPASDGGGSGGDGSQASVSGILGMMFVVAGVWHILMAGGLYETMQPTPSECVVAEASIVGKGAAMVGKEVAMVGKEVDMVGKEAAMVGKEAAIVGKGAAIVGKGAAMVDKDTESVLADVTMGKYIRRYIHVNAVRVLTTIQNVRAGASLLPLSTANVDNMVSTVVEPSPMVMNREDDGGRMNTKNKNQIRNKIKWLNQVTSEVTEELNAVSPPPLKDSFDSAVKNVVSAEFSAVGGFVGNVVTDLKDGFIGLKDTIVSMAPETNSPAEGEQQHESGSSSVMTDVPYSPSVNDTP